VNGPYRWVVAAMMGCNLLTPHLFWSRRLRRNPAVLFAGATLIWAGMWCERFTIIVGSLSQDFLPANWHDFHPSWVDWSLLAGSIGFFTLLFLAFLRWVPAISINELQAQRERTRSDVAAN
jgi:molybdopterin-containing oxidoreductase family membrane subunit